MPPLNLEAMAGARIQGERIYLRHLERSDVSERYLAWMRDPKVNRYLESRFAQHSLESLADFVHSMLRDPLNLFAGIFICETDRHIGNIKLGPIDIYHRHADVGLLVGERDCWGKGYASEAIRILTDFAFRDLGLHRLGAGVYAENEGSARAFEKAGWRREGVLKDQWRCEDRYQDGIRLGKVNDLHDLT